MDLCVLYLSLIMKVISTNIGEKQTVNYRGKEVLTGIYKYPVKSALLLGKEDVENDAVIDRRYHGGIDKACYLYSADHYAFWKEKFTDLKWQWGMFGENLSVSNLDESEIFIGDIYKVGSARVQVTQPRQPCFKLGIRLENAKAVKDFVKAEKPGVYVKVINEGKVRKNDTFILESRIQEEFSIKLIYHLLYHAKENIEQINRAIQIPELAESCRKDLIKAAYLKL